LLTRHFMPSLSQQRFLAPSPVSTTTVSSTTTSILYPQSGLLGVSASLRFMFSLTAEARRRGGGLVVVDEAFHAVFEHGRMEVQQEADLAMVKFEVREQLRLVNRE